MVFSKGEKKENGQIVTKQFHVQKSQFRTSNIIPLLWGLVAVPGLLAVITNDSTTRISLKLYAKNIKTLYNEMITIRGRMQEEVGLLY